MDALFLNFPTFYHSAIKGNTSLPQYNAVSVLLLGNVRERCTKESIDDPSVSVYVSGRKPIRKSILMPLLNISHEEAVRRLHMLGIQDIQRMVDALTTLIGEVANLSDTAKTPLLALADTMGAEYDFVAEVFLTAVKCPTTFMHRLSSEMIRYLNSMGWPEQFVPTSNSSDTSEAVQGTVSDSENNSEPVIQEEDVQTPIKFSQDAMEISVSYRRLSIPEDKDAAISYFLNFCSNSFINLDDQDVSTIISEEEGFHYFLIDLRGAYQSVIFELSRWERIPKCIGCIFVIETSLDLGFETVDGIASSIKDLTHEDAYVIFGTSFAPEFLTDQVHVCTIFKIQDDFPKDAATEKGKSQHFEGFHSDGETKDEDDLFDELLQIFKKRP